MSFSIQKINNRYHCYNDITGLEIVLDDELYLQVAVKKNKDEVFQFYSPTQRELDECIELIESMGV